MALAWPRGRTATRPHAVTDPSLVDRELRKLAELAKPLGAEAGHALLLVLVHRRYRSMLAATGESWRSLLTSGPDERVDYWEAAFITGSGDWRYDALVPRRGRVRGSELWRAAKQLDALLDVLSREYGLREAHQQLFERVLGDSIRVENRTLEASTTHSDVAEVMVALCDHALGAVLDPAAGFGTALLAAGRSAAARLQGWDINERALAVLRMRADLADMAVDTRQRNTLVEVTGAGAADTVLLAPPWGLRPGSMEISPDWRWGEKGPLDLLWLLVARRLMRRQAVVHAPLGVLQRREQGPGRAEVLQSLHAVVALPGGARAGTGLRSALVLLDEAPRDDVLMLSLDGAGAGRSGDLDQSRVDDVLARLRAWRSGEKVDKLGIAQRVLKRDLLPDGSLVPARYVGKGAELRNARPEPAEHLIRSIELENIKSFGGAQNAQLAPITLVYGPNASGKSTLLQSLMRLKQSLEEGAPLLNGTHARLGGLAALVHRHDLDRCPRVRIEMDLPARWDVAAECFTPSASRSFEVVFGVGIGGSVELQAVTLGAGSDRYRLTRGDDARWRLAAEDAVALVEAVSDAERVWHVKPSARTLSASRCSDVRGVLRNAEIEWVPFTAAGLLPDRLDLDLSPYSDGAVIDRAQLAETSLRRATNVLDAVRGDIERLLREMGYLGPIRSAPKRTYERGSVNRYRTLDPEGSDAANFLFDNPSEAGEAGIWLGRLKIPYSVDVHALESDHPGVGDVLHLELADQRFDPPVSVSPADVGFGVSQVLPLVVQLLAARDQVICIEQPEIHLHPRLQAEFAELLIQATFAEGQANQVIVETHSEHLMLRLQRRIREGELDPEDVSVLYVDLNQVSQETTIKRLRLDANGRFLDRWPGGFFDERFHEVFDNAKLADLPLDDDAENEDIA